MSPTPLPTTLDTSSFTKVSEEPKILPWWGVLLVALVFGALALLGIWLTRGDGRIAALWLPNGLLTAVLLRRGVQRQGFILSGALLANIIANLLSGDGIFRACGLSLCNSLEVILAYRLSLHLCAGSPNLTEPRDFGRFAIAGGIVAPAVAAAVSTLILGVTSLSDFVSGWWSWYAADALGMLIGVPLIWNLCPRNWAIAQMTRARIMEWVIILTSGSLLTAALFAQSRYPFLFMAAPFVVVAAFRLGVSGTAVATVLISLIASIATAHNVGPISLVRGDLQDKVLTLQLFIFTIFVSSFPAAASINTRRRMAQELTQSRDYVRTIVDNVQEVIFRADAKGRWTYLNPAWERLTGQKVAYAMGRRVDELLSPEDLEANARIYPQLANGQLSQCDLQQRFRRADGQWRDIEITIRTLRNEQGRFTGTAGNIRDVTERRIGELALQSSERRFHTLTEMSPGAVIRVNAESACTYVNPAWVKLIGMSADDAMDAGWKNSIFPDDQANLESMWSLALETGEAIERECRLRHISGRSVWAMVATAPEYDDAGQLVGLITVAIDTSVQKQTEIALAAREREMRFFADHVTDAVLRLDLKGICRFTTPSVRDVLGYDPERLTGLSFLSMVHPGDESNVRTMFQRLADGAVIRETITYRFMSDHAAQKFLWIEAHLKAVRTPQGGPVEIIASLRDVSQRKEMEQELVRAKLHAEAAARAKATFLANMSHELRTPMNGVIGFTELLMNEKLTAKQHRQIELIADSGRTMMRLLNDILDISKIDAGQMDVASEPIDPCHVARSVVKLMAPAAEKKGLALTFEATPGVPEAMFGDGLRLRQILTNLVGNAVKFTASGYIQIAIITSHENDKDFIDITVTDTGIGIASGRRIAIFDEFVQADEGTGRKYGGTGLGLAISRKLAELMGGVLTLDAPAGPGSTFRLRLPLWVAKKTDQADILRGAPNAVAAAPGEPTILVVEDHDINRELVTSLLQRLGYKFDVAGNGREAVLAVAKAAESGRRFDAVLMDIQMPEMDGLEATRRIRAMNISSTDLPIIALTANAYAEDIEECIAAGMQAHVAKPLRIDELRQVLDHYICSQPVAVRPSSPTGAGKIEALRKRYDVFKRECLESLQHFDNGQEKGAEVQALMHKLVGTAALFNDAELGSAARKMETAITSNEDIEQTCAMVIKLLT